MKIISSLFATLVLVVLAINPAHAQSAGYPSRPINLLVTVPPGSDIDTTARIAGQ